MYNARIVDNGYKQRIDFDETFLLIVM
jgi:hypothetical protein